MDTCERVGTVHRVVVSVDGLFNSDLNAEQRALNDGP